MKRFIFPLLFVFALVGCGTLNESYVKADRANYEAIAPVISGYIHGTLVPPTSDIKDSYESRLVLWNARITKAEQALLEAEKD